MASVRRVVEEALRGGDTVFRDRAALYPEYLPPGLPHREAQLRRLAEVFRPLLTAPGSARACALLVGPPGTGKTAAARLLGSAMRSLAAERGVDLRYAYVDCRAAGAPLDAVVEAARQLGAPAQLRGLPLHEAVRRLLHHLERRGACALVVLDGLDHPAGGGAARLADLLWGWAGVGLGIALVARDPSALRRLDPALESAALRNAVEFPPYTSTELLDVLAQRSAAAFREGAVEEAALRLIADAEGVDRGGGGSAARAIGLLLLAGEEAAREGAPRVTVEHAARALSQLAPRPPQPRWSAALRGAGLHELLVLKAAARALRRSGAGYARIGEVEREYRALCEALGERPRHHTQVYTYVRRLAELGALEARPSGRGHRGRTTLISLRAPPDEVEKQVDALLGLR